MTTREQVHAAIEAVKAIAETIRKLGEVPSGHLYARLMGAGMSLETYHQIIATLKRAGLIEELPSHLLRWTGPEADTPAPRKEDAHA